MKDNTYVSLINKLNCEIEDFLETCFTNCVGKHIFNVRGKLNRLGVWLSWRETSSGLPDDFAWDTNIACTTGL